MLRDRDTRLQVDQWIDKLTPKVAAIQFVLAQLRPEEVAWRSGATLQGGRLHLQMLFQPYEVDAVSYVVSRPDGKTVTPFYQSLLLTYLQTADGAPSADRWISFRELPNGGFYHQAFQGYGPDRLTKRWALDAQGFGAACRALGGTPLQLGDAAFAFRVLPRVDLAVIYWLGDEEFPSRALVLFDASAGHYMVTDGLAILGSHLVGRILSSGASEDSAADEAQDCC